MQSSQVPLQRCGRHMSHEVHHRDALHPSARNHRVQHPQPVAVLALHLPHLIHPPLLLGRMHARVRHTEQRHHDHIHRVGDAQVSPVVGLELCVAAVVMQQAPHRRPQVHRQALQPHRAAPVRVMIDGRQPGAEKRRRPQIQGAHQGLLGHGLARTHVAADVHIEHRQLSSGNQRSRCSNRTRHRFHVNQ